MVKEIETHNIDFSSLLGGNGCDGKKNLILMSGSEYIEQQWVEQMG